MKRVLPTTAARRPRAPWLPIGIAAVVVLTGAIFAGWVVGALERHPAVSPGSGQLSVKIDRPARIWINDHEVTTRPGWYWEGWIQANTGVLDSHVVRVRYQHSGREQSYRARVRPGAFTSVAFHEGVPVALVTAWTAAREAVENALPTPASTPAPSPIPVLTPWPEEALARLTVDERRQVAMDLYDRGHRQAERGYVFGAALTMDEAVRVYPEPGEHHCFAAVVQLCRGDVDCDSARLCPKESENYHLVEEIMDARCSAGPAGPRPDPDAYPGCVACGSDERASFDVLKPITR